MLVTLLLKFKNKDCKTTELGLLLQVLPVRIVTFVETLGSHLKAGGGEGGRAWGVDLTFLKNLPANALPMGKLFQSNAQKFPHPGQHIAVNYSQAGCKKDARKTLLHLQRYMFKNHSICL